MTYLFLVTVFLITPLAMGYALRNMRSRRLARARLFHDVDEARRPEDAEVDQDFLTRWLFLAGYRSPRATSAFLGLTALAVAIGLLVPILYSALGISRQFARGLSVIPGAIGEIFLPFVYLAPWIIMLCVASLPWLNVRRARRQRVQQFEQDLPIYLELFATLSEAGLGFDASLDRVLAAQSDDRVLADEFRTYQLEVLAGRRRTECLRRLGRRADVLTLTIFVSAMIQAEQVGSGVAMVLRRQADDLRERRREDLLAKAMTLPVKQLFPLVMCFLPGIFVITLGPIFYQFFQLAEGLIRSRGGSP